MDNPTGQPRRRPERFVQLTRTFREAGTTWRECLRRTDSSRYSHRGRVESIGDGRSSAFGSLLRRYRLAAELSQEVLAERARVSPATVSTLERGTRQAPHRETVLMLA